MPCSAELQFGFSKAGLETGDPFEILMQLARLSTSYGVDFTLEPVLTCSLALLEMTFVFVGLLILHSLRRLVFGHAAFYIAIGILLIFTQLVSATELKVILGYPGADFYIAQSILFLPYLAIILVVYVSEGTLSTQRMIIGAMVALGFYVYLSQITIIQCGWTGYSISQGSSADSLDYLLRYSRKTLASSILAQTLDLFLIPIFFQRLRNLGCRLFVCVLGALMLTQIVDTFVYVTACFWGDPQWWLFIKSSYIIKSFSTVWLSFIATIYLSRIEKEQPGQDRGTLDIILSFLGSSGRAQALQRNLHEWEGRYRAVVDSSSGMILLLDRAGKILDANPAAEKLMEIQSKKELIGRNILDILAETEQFPFRPDVSWEYLDTDTDEIRPEPIQSTSFPLRARTASGNKLELDATSSIVNVENIPMMIFYAKDVTEQNRLEREKEELREQLSHAQRLEAVGKLAGGVAHDFNNYLHSIQGNLDILLYMHDIEDEKILKHLKRINDITEQSAKLTQQLLGFARKGKYRVEVIDICDLMKETVRLFTPQSLKNIDFEQKIPSAKMWVKGDPVQLKQVFLNMFINARDACETAPKPDSRIEVIAANGAKFAEQFVIACRSLDQFAAEDYHCLVIRDNGCGIDGDTLPRIFDPFFTTKPVGKGTGMGLAMVYGTITNHQGFINVESEHRLGTAFYIFLPANQETDNEKSLP